MKNINFGFTYTIDVVNPIPLDDAQVGYFEYPIYVTILSNGKCTYKQLTTVPSTKMSEEQVAKFVESLNEARDRVINKEE